MTAQELIQLQTRRHIASLGYTPAEAEDTANMIVDMYRKNLLVKATDFLADATKYAKQQYGKPQKPKAGQQ